MSVKIIVDSSCDLSVEFAAQNNISMVPVHVIFSTHAGVIDYTHHKDITTEEFYEKLVVSSEQPRTSQPSPYEFLCEYKNALEYDQIVCLTVTSKMSGVYNSANVAAAMLKDNGYGDNLPFLPEVYVFDTENCSGGAALMALYAADLAKKGKNAKEIVSALEAIRSQIGTYFVLDTLVYARRAGRTGGIRPILGEILGIKPVLTFIDGVVTDIDKIKSSRGIEKWLLDRFERYSLNHDFVIIYHSMAIERASALEQKFIDRYPGINTLMLSVGAVIGVYTGTGCLGISFKHKI